MTVRATPSRLQWDVCGAEAGMNWNKNYLTTIIVCCLIIGCYVTYTWHSNILYAVTDEPSEDIQFSDESAGVTRADVSRQTRHDVSKVLLVTYMRGGSSLLGEIFNQNKDAFYWFEPMDGFYSHLYGTHHGWVPLDIFYNQDQTIRELTDLEVATLTRGLQDMFNCNLSTLPVDVLTNSNLLNLEQNSFKPYTDCLKTGRLSKDVQLRPKPSSSRFCKSQIGEYCPAEFTAKQELEQCKDTLFPHHELLREEKEDSGSATEYIPAETLSSYIQCMNSSHHSSRPCLALLQGSCSASGIRALKAIRLRVSMLDDVIRAIPDVKIVVSFRDPRGTVVSRRWTGLLSHAAKDIENEGRLLCQRLLSEIVFLTQLSKTYPNNIMQFKYEDMAEQPIKVIESIYDFVGKPVPGNVRDWFRENTSVGKGTGAYDTSGKNATETAYKWRKKLDTKEKKVITESCGRVLELLGYE